ncbi:hypothetical protein BDW02DRAFT_325716 [Decorospora gaudefroyi]|uniref:Uncharacterized protein n=1 Tax=Decorospora gaudefroyi TaxID=184978 RepID=A0A6A5KEP9_9PLEO|nr:hypothetical protein BDW02DRAFT_325716 [Decorospora gaudefroyi]
MRANTVAVIALPLLAAGARHGHNHAEAHRDGAHRRALITEVIVVTETIFETLILESSSTSSANPPCYPSAILSVSSSLPLTNSTKVPEEDAPPVASPTTSPPKDNTDGKNFSILIPEAYTALVKNSCDYDVYITSSGDDSCGPGVDCQLVPANTTYTEKIRICDRSGISLKVAMTEAMTDVMQFEYTVWDDQKTVSYDISYLDCMKNGNGEQDLSACAGHDGGIQAAAGADCPTYQCVANEWCAQQAYVVAEFDYKPGAPVGACGIEKGIAFELCAGNRSE